MSWHGIIQMALFMTVLTLLVKPLGAYMARVYEGRPLVLQRVFGPIERLIYRWCRVKPDGEMTWKGYAWALIVTNALGMLAVFALARLQGHLPINPMHRPGMAPDLAFNTAVSFATNTNWQSYSGEAALSYLTQMLGLGVQNFLSAASGMAVLAALVRGLARDTAKTIGSFWTDLVRGTLYILLPLSLVLAVLLVSQGVVQTFRASQEATLIEPMRGPQGQLVTRQVLALGPAASQIAIKQLGTNGGGFFGANSAHPFENPTPLANFLEMLAILLIPAALCYTFGRMVGRTRQGWTVFGAMTLLFVPLLVLCLHSEQAANPAIDGLGIRQDLTATQPGGNMEGKEVRFGIAGSALWATGTTAASNGSVNSMHDSFTPLGSLGPLWLMQLGEVVYGGVGSGLYGMLVFAIVAVFIAGLMVGRTPEYLGKKIEAYEIKMASLVILIPPALVLIGTTAATLGRAGRAAVLNPGPHGFTEILYAFSSAANNNGSAFAGLATNTVFYNVALALCMFFGRYGLMIPTLALAGSLAGKRHLPAGPGTLATDTPLFVVFLAAVVVIIGALTFVPALALGPIAERLMMP
ncbi:MAG: potassium-transporting ATPase subunit KdpA [bacterium]